MRTPKRIQCASGSNPDLAGDLDGCLAFHSEAAMQLNRIVSAHLAGLHGFGGRQGPSGGCADLDPPRFFGAGMLTCLRWSTALSERSRPSPYAFEAVEIEAGHFAAVGIA
jgi:hypothetical protein